MANSTFSGGCFMQGLQTRYGSLSLGAAAATLGQAQTAREVIRYGFQKRLPISADRPHFEHLMPNGTLPIESYDNSYSFS